MSRLNDLYKGEIRKSLREKFGYTNEMEIPKLEKIVIGTTKISTYKHVHTCSQFLCQLPYQINTRH